MAHFSLLNGGRLPPELGSSFSSLPKKFARYEVNRELGKGAMGIVYLGKDPVIGRLVALKTIRVAGEDDAERREFNERFLREAQAAGILSHPNIVTVHDVGEDPDTHTSFIAMEYVEGKNLKQLISEKTVFSFERVAEIIGQVAEALDYAHRRGIVHRDVKPANIIITHEGAVKITDFGIAKIEKSNLTSTGQFLGTPNYMSPEQVTGESVDGRSDLFSLGVVFYELLTRKKPFAGDNLTAISYKIVHETFTPPETYDASLPPEFAPILSRALAKDPAGRYQRGNDFALALYEFKARQEERQLLQDLGKMVAEAENLGPVSAVDSPPPTFPDPQAPAKVSASSAPLAIERIGLMPPQLTIPPRNEVPYIETSAPDWMLDEPSTGSKARPVPAPTVRKDVEASVPGEEVPAAPESRTPEPEPFEEHKTQRLEMAGLLTHGGSPPPPAPPSPIPPPAPARPPAPAPVSEKTERMELPLPMPPPPRPGIPRVSTPVDPTAIENRPTEMIVDAAALARAGAPKPTPSRGVPVAPPPPRVPTPAPVPKLAPAPPPRAPVSEPVRTAPAAAPVSATVPTPVQTPAVSRPALKREVSARFAFMIAGGAILAALAVVAVLWSRRAAVDKAAAGVDDAVARETAERRSLMDAGNRLVQEGKLEEALQSFREVVRRAPDSNAAREAIQKTEALFLAQQEQTKKAAEIEGHLAAARDAQTRTPPDDARVMAEVEGALQLDPENAEAKAMKDAAAERVSKKSAAEQKKVAEAAKAAKKKAKPTPVPVAVAPPPPKPQEPMKPPPPTPTLANLRISFQSPISKGLLMVGIGDRIVFRKDFDFGKGSPGGTVDGSVAVSAGTVQMKVWLISPDRSINQYLAAFPGLVPGGETRTLVLELDAASRKLTASVR